MVARRLTLTACCGESYCKDCVPDTQQQYQPCPACGQDSFTTIQLAKYLKQIESLRVFCSMKEKGCGWSGTVGELDTHLDPDQDNCQYVDTKCPLNCQQTIPKNEVEQHVAEECTKREFICQHCGFKATYEEVVNIHLPECKYVPLKCPNLCGVTCDREDMEDHMKMCRLEEVACEFKEMGCNQKFKREDREEHFMENMQNHLTYTAASMNTERHERQECLVEQQKIQEHLKLELKEQSTLLQLQKVRMQDLERQLEDKHNLLNEQERKIERLNGCLRNQDVRVQDLLRESNERLEMLELKYDQLHAEQQEKLGILQQRLEHSDAISKSRNFKMKGFSVEKKKNVTNDWKSPSMYTHLYGYKFCIGIDANGHGVTRGNAMRVELWSMEGKFDNQLKWPAKVTVTLELVNQRGGENVRATVHDVQLNKVTGTTLNCALGDIPGNGFIKHSKLENFLVDDTLTFHITECTVW